MRLLKSPVALLIVAALLLPVVIGLPAQLSLSSLPQEESYTFGSSTWTKGYSGTVKFSPGVYDKSGAAYISSWYAEQRSESITVQGSIRSLGGAHISHEYKYRFMLDTGSGWKVIKETDPAYVNGPGPLTLKAETIHLTGPMRAVLRVDLMVKAYQGAWTVAAQDGANILNGSSSVTVAKGASDKVEEGETVRFDVSTGSGAWSLLMFNGQGAPVCGLTFKQTLSLLRFDNRDGDADTGGSSTPTDPCALKWTGSRQGVASFTIPAGAFVTGGNNIWRIVLRNEVVNQAQDQFVTVDQKAKAPAPPVVDPSDPTPKVDDVVTLKLTGETNPKTGLAISHFLVYVWYGNTDLPPSAGAATWIINGATVTATPTGATNYAGTISFKVTERAVIQSRVYAIDSEGRPSGSDLNPGDHEDTKDAYGKDVPDNSRGTFKTEGSEDVATGPQAPISASSAALFIVLAFAALAAWVVWRYVPLAPLYRFGIIGVGALTLVIMLGGLS